MTAEEARKYESRLAAMVNTRLLFNTIREYEDFLGVQSLHSNGVKRCFPGAARLRACYRDCSAEVEEQTEGGCYLAIDERLLYIPLTPKDLGSYGIERVYEID